MRAFFGIVLVLLCLVTLVVLRSLHDDRMDEAVRRIDDAVRTAFRDEEARPAWDYEPYPYLRKEAYSRQFQKLGKEEVKVPSVEDLAGRFGKMLPRGTIIVWKLRSLSHSLLLTRPRTVV